MEDIFFSILEDDDGEIFLFNKNIKQKEIDTLFGTKTNEQTKAETKIDLSIPKMEIKNLNIICRDHDKRTFLWSVNNLNLYIYNFLLPPDKNKDLWSILLSANLNEKTNSTILFSAKCRTLPDNSFLKLNVAAKNIDLKTFDMIVDSGKSAGKNSKISKSAKKHTNSQNNEPSPFNVVFNCFSNEFKRITTVFNKKVKEEKLNQNVTNLFNNTSVSNLVFDFKWDMTVSNHVFNKGNISLKIYTGNTNLPTLIYQYSITNTAKLLVN